jgi:solute carrier family 12 (potassium/chloride transporters), member 9
MISRSLGPEFGGSIGVIFFLANITNGATFLLGFGEAISASVSRLSHYNCLISLLKNVFFQFPLMPTGRWWSVLYIAICLLILVVIGLLGADVFSKINSVIFIMVSYANSS